MNAPILTKKQTHAEAMAELLAKLRYTADRPLSHTVLHSPEAKALLDEIERLRRELEVALQRIDHTATDIRSALEPESPHK